MDLRPYATPMPAADEATAGHGNVNDVVVVVAAAAATMTVGIASVLLNQVTTAWCLPGKASKLPRSFACSARKCSRRPAAAAAAVALASSAWVSSSSSSSSSRR